MGLKSGMRTISQQEAERRGPPSPHAQMSPSAASTVGGFNEANAGILQQAADKTEPTQVSLFLVNFY